MRRKSRTLRALEEAKIFWPGARLKTFARKWLGKRRSAKEWKIYKGTGALMQKFRIRRR